jgi:DnaJ-class molecular chaperone
MRGGLHQVLSNFGEFLQQRPPPPPTSHSSSSSFFQPMQPQQTPFNPLCQPRPVVLKKQQLNLNVSLEELYTRAVKVVDVLRVTACSQCNSSGMEMLPCQDCKGCGYTVNKGKRMVCPSCDLQGSVPHECTVCAGMKSVLQPDKLNVELDSGMDLSRPLCYKHTFLKPVTGATTMETGGGNSSTTFAFDASSTSMNETTLEIFVREQDHDKFERKGAHLYVTQSLSLEDALCGVTFALQHLDGEEYLIETKDIVRDGEVRHLDGLGFFHEPPHENMNGLSQERARGDLHVRLRINYPNEPLSEEARALIRTALMKKKNPSEPDLLTTSSSSSNTTTTINHDVVVPPPPSVS